MSHYNLQLALLCLVLTLALQALAPNIPATLLQAARIVQLLLGVFFIYFASCLILAHLGS